MSCLIQTEAAVDLGIQEYNNENITVIIYYFRRVIYDGRFFIAEQT